MEIETDMNISDGWLCNFKIRHGIKAINVSGEKSTGIDAAVQFSERFAMLVNEHKLFHILPVPPSLGISLRC